jgi:hypothetical protein
MTGKNAIPHTQRKSGEKARRREQKRQEAKERQARYDALTIAEKLAQINERPGWSAREKARLVGE